MFSDIFSHSGYFFCLQVTPDFFVSYNIDHLQQMVLTFTLLKRAVAPVYNFNGNTIPTTWYETRGPRCIQNLRCLRMFLMLHQKDSTCDLSISTVTLFHILRYSSLKRTSFSCVFTSFHQFCWNIYLNVGLNNK
jgi:hypothetical protein